MANTINPLTALPQAIGPRGEAGDKVTAERVKALAVEFESMLVGQMMQQMRASLFDTGNEGERDTAPLADALFAELSLALARAGGLGLADSLASPLVREAGGATTDADAVAPSDDAMTPLMAPTMSPALGGRISSAYGWRRDPLGDALKFHRGMDIAMPVGQEVPAPQAGTVTFAGEQPGYGLTVVVDHGGELTTRYAHLSEIQVKPGDPVQAGQVIALSGATGRVTGPHLHVEVTEAGRTVNPSERLANYAAVRPQ